MKYLLTLILAATVLTGCAGRNPYERVAYQQPTQAYRGAVVQVQTPPMSQYKFQPLIQNQQYTQQRVQRYVQQPVQQQYRQPVQTTQFQRYLEQQPVQQNQGYYQNQGYQNQGYQNQGYQDQGYRQQSSRRDPVQRCQQNASDRQIDIEARYKASVMYNNDGLFSGASARSQRYDALQSLQKSFTSCMQNAQRQVIRDQMKQQQQGYQSQYVRY